MKLSCNGCRILRKGCNENCIIRGCLDWISSPESQSNATLFLAKFYGRTGLLNLLSAAPQHLRPAVFRSLLYEACGRLVNPTYGSLGLIWSGEWARCEAAVEAVLSGSKISDVADCDWCVTETHGEDHVIAVCDIRHVAKPTNVEDVATRERNLFNTAREIIKPQARVGSVDKASLGRTGWESESVETVEPSLVNQDGPNRTGEIGVNLKLTLGFSCQSSSCKKRRYS
ncbi:hypothetical protein RJT34_25545 [Clitoria ternatea]|uniref:LOB domain-containing protein n=1 Tax=Clitoria ternatea TaxID=43366 RepID=A0AAN9ILG3_CLITE